MLKNLEISNFRTFKHLEMSDLPRVCLISGQNSVGKSTLLETIFFFYSSHRNDMLTRAQITRTRPLLADTFLPSLFHNYDTTRGAALKFIDHTSSAYKNEYFLTKGDSPSNKNLRNKYGIMPDSVLTISGSEEYTSLGGRKQRDPETSYLCTYAQKTEEPKLYGDISQPKESIVFFTAHGNIAEASPSRPKSMEEYFSDLGETGREGELIDTIKRIVPTIVTIKLGMKDGQPRLMCNFEGVPQGIPLTHAGDGVLRAFNIILQTMINQPDILLIDEIGNGIHYSVLNVLWKAIFENARAHGCQIFLTTHSYECIEAAVEAYNELQVPGGENLFAFYRLEKRKNDTIEAIRYTSDDLAEVIDSNWEIR